MSEPDREVLILEARQRLHVLSALAFALDRRAEVRDIIDAAESADAARAVLSSKFGIDEVQATAILDLQMRRFARYERERILGELTDMQRRLGELER